MSLQVNILTILPLEVLEIVFLNLDSKSCVNLVRICSDIHNKLSENLKFWRHVCIGLGLDTVEWCGTRSRTQARHMDFWKSIYHRWKNSERFLLSSKEFQVERIYADVNSVGESGKTKASQRVVQLPKNHKTVPNFKTLKRKLIRESIFSYAMSEIYFVLIVSSSKSYFSHLTVWNIQSSTSFAYTVNQNNFPNSEMSNLWLACSEDLLVHNNLLILMATKAEPSSFFNEAKPCNSDLIHVFDLQNGREDSSNFLVSKYTTPQSSVRFMPLYLKDGGGSKLLVWGNILLAVCPEVSSDYYRREPDIEPDLVLRFFDLSREMTGGTSDVEQLEMVAQQRLEGVQLKQPYSYFACDQKGPNIVLAFSKQDKNDHFMSQQFVTLSLECKDTIISSIITYDTANMSRIPNLLSNDNGVMRREECLIAASEQYNVFGVMDASGLVQLSDGRGKFRQFYPVYGISDDFDTFYDELHIYGDKVVTMKIYLNREMSVGCKNTILALSNFTGELIWKLKTNIVLQNTGERLYLSPMFNHLFVSDAKKTVVYDLATGKIKNIVHYPKYKRQSKELDSHDPHTSAYAQTGVSIWDLRRMGDRVVVVHDVERVNPVIADFINFC